MSKLGDRPSFLRLVRWVAVCLLIALGVTLSATSLSGYWVVKGALHTVVQGQGESLIQAIELATRRGTITDDGVLKTILDNETPRGLRCVVLFDLTVVQTAGAAPGPSLQPLISVGSCLTPKSAWGDMVGRQRARAMPSIGDRLIMSKGPPPLGPGAMPFQPPGLLQPPYGVPPPPGAPWPAPAVAPGVDAPSPGPAWPGPPPQAFLPPNSALHAPPHESRRPRPMFIEFVPRMAEALRWSAVRTLLSGGFATLALLIAAGIFWQFSLREERAYENKERQRQLASLGEMAAVLAHELRNPLAALKGHAQLLLEQLPSGSRSHDKCNRVVSEAERLEALSEDLLSFVRTTAIHTQTVNPAELLTECVAAVDDPRLEVVTQHAPPRWHLDPERMRQVLCNLLRNALDASPEDGRVTASVTTEKNQLILCIRDHGKGIRAQDLERIFEPFYTTRARGTGLGLPIARRLVSLHGGSITAENAAEGGALFSIRLPAVIPGA